MGLENLIAYGRPDYYERGNNTPYYNYIYNTYKNNMINEKYVSRNDYKEFINAKFHLKKISEDEYNSITNFIKNEENTENNEIIEKYNKYNSFGEKLNRVFNSFWNKIF